VECVGSPNLFPHGPLAVLRGKGVAGPVKVSFLNNPQLLKPYRHPAGLGSLHSFQVCPPFGIPQTMFVVYAFGWNFVVNG
jgi:hypothetical protein